MGDESVIFPWDLELGPTGTGTCLFQFLVIFFCCWLRVLDYADHTQLFRTRLTAIVSYVEQATQTDLTNSTVN